jgi:Na+/H+ antiporter NhaD/arsenite permease-like protein
MPCFTPSLAPAFESLPLLIKAAGQVTGLIAYRRRETSSSVTHTFRAHALTIGAAMLAIAFLATGRVTVRVALASVDYDLLLVLFALLISVELLRTSGALDHAVAVALSGALAALVTNDVALFIIIPFTVVASRFSDFDLENAVILEIIATNLLGCLTPLGNPQNLFVFHRSGWSALQFVTTMLPFVAFSALGLGLAALLLGRSAPMITTELTLPRVQRNVASAGAIVFALVLLEIAHIARAWPAAIAATVAWLVFLRRPLDLSIVPLFFFAFIIVEGLRTFAFGLVGSLYLTSIGLSQVISNVPATVLLSPFANGNWRELLYGVNAGGCGTIIASLANLLGWRIYVRESGREPRFFRRLTALNFAFLVWIGIGAWLLL